VFAAFAVAADAPPAPGARPVIRVAPEKSAGGITVDAYFDRQARLQRWLTNEMPDGTLGAVVRADVTAQDLDNIANAPPRPLRIGVVKTIRPVNVAGVGNMQPRSVYEESPGGGFTWATTISSPGADGIRVHFANFSVPQGAEMYIFSQAGDAHGPYTGEGRNRDGDFWTHTVFSDTAVLLLSHPGQATPRDRANVRFVIDRVGHIRLNRPIADPQDWNQNQCDNASCVLDANCGSVAPADQSAIAKYEWVAGAWIYTCTGGLIADTDNSSQRNLFLTANHCMSKNRDARNLETFFFYTTSSCNGNCPAWPSAPSTIGSSILATGRDGDYSLLELSENPPSGTSFLGWTNSPIAFTNGADLYRVSNPNYGPQVYSHHQVDTGAGTCSGLPRGEIIYSHDVDGATDGGSSGSPVVNSSGEIVGQLYGCCGYNCADVCDSGSNSTIDGALAYYYDNVAEFLNPTACVPSPEVCDNGVDDDCDNAVDCDDSDCTGDPACEGCTLGQRRDPCSSGADCCSGICKRNGTCR
jgi:V8-like Glu-specific endopeptidase